MCSLSFTFDMTFSFLSIDILVLHGLYLNDTYVSKRLFLAYVVVQYTKHGTYEKYYDALE